MQYDPILTWLTLPTHTAIKLRIFPIRRLTQHLSAKLAEPHLDSIEHELCKKIFSWLSI